MAGPRRLWSSARPLLGLYQLHDDDNAYHIADDLPLPATAHSPVRRTFFGSFDGPASVDPTPASSRTPSVRSFISSVDGPSSPESEPEDSSKRASRRAWVTHIFMLLLGFSAWTTIYLLHNVWTTERTFNFKFERYSDHLCSGRHIHKVRDVSHGKCETFAHGFHGYKFRWTKIHLLDDDRGDIEKFHGCELRLWADGGCTGPFNGALLNASSPEAYDLPGHDRCWAPPEWYPPTKSLMMVCAAVDK